MTRVPCYLVRHSKKKKMEYLLKKNDFEVIKGFENDLLFYSPNSQLFPLLDKSIIEYIKICSGEKSIENTVLKKNNIKEIYSFLNHKFNNNKKPVISNYINNEIESVILPIAGICNLECSYCFARVEGDFSFSNISKNEVEKIIDSIFAKKKNNKLTITFFGGEPFLKFDIIQHTIHYIDKNYKDKEIYYTVTTNGTILTSKILSFIKKYKLAILVSIDGPKHVNIHRVYHSKKNSFDDVIKNILILKENNINIELRATLTNDTKDIVEVFSFFENLKIPFNIVFAYDSENKSHELSQHKDNLLHIKKQFEKLYTYYVDRIKKNKKIFAYSILSKLETIQFRVKKHYSCGGGHNFFSITNQGDIYSCEHLVGLEKYSSGNIHNDFSMEKFHLKSVDVEKIDACDDCWAKYLCSGGCFSSNISSTGNYLKPELSRCELTKMEWKFILNLYYSIKKIAPNYFKVESANTVSNEC